MDNWIPNATTLIGETVDLIPLEQMHFAVLESLAKDKRIWEFYAYDGSDQAVFANILLNRFSELK
ncbi:MAG: hypothetical protein IT262_10335 [Saprospiraceae bacterium]|nr:hypothetical protein [Saprospiraceae bacterium]